VRVNPVDPPGVLRRSFADEPPQAGISGPSEGRQSSPVGPPKPAGGRGKARTLGRWRNVIVAE
jgi:hypothetical protein